MHHYCLLPSLHFPPHFLFLPASFVCILPVQINKTCKIINKVKRKENEKRKSEERKKKKRERKKRKERKERRKRGKERKKRRPSSFGTMRNEEDRHGITNSSYFDPAGHILDKVLEVRKRHVVTCPYGPVVYW